MPAAIGQSNPNPARFWMVPAHQRADRLDGDVGGEDEVADGDELELVDTGGGVAGWSREK